MRNILYFILNHATALYFVLLEIVCVVLIVNFNDFHRSAFMSSSNSVCGAIYSGKSAVAKYFSYGTANEQLMNENVHLRNEVERLKAELASLGDSVIGDSTEAKYFHRTAHVVNSTTNRSRNFLTLDIGSEEGVRHDMIVSSQGNVVGIVTATSAHYSTVLPIVNTSFHLSTKTEGTNYRGQLIWDATSPEKATMTDVPEHARVNIGDEVVTSGSSSYFPEGMSVGIVEDVQMDRNGGFYSLSVRLATDFNSIYNVVVTENMQMREQQELEKLSADE